MHAHRQTAITPHRFQDAHSGLSLTRYGGHIGHSHCLYFTSDGWTADQRHFLCAMETAELGNQLYAIELSSGRLSQLTNLAQGAAPQHRFNYASLSPDGGRVAYWDADDLVVQHLASGERSVIYHAEGEVHGTCWTADGRQVLTCRSEECQLGSGTSTADRLRWLSAPPLSQVLAIDAGGGGERVLHEERWLITHVNASPTDPDLCTFCHEGPWLTIDQRIWGLRLSGGSAWPVVPHDGVWGVGHEFWCADGRTVGYHARHKDGTWRHAAGFVDVLSAQVWQAEISVPTHHAVAIDNQRMILDGTRESGEWLLLIDREGDQWGEPRVLCRHDSSRHHHRVHVHPRLRRDGRQISFNSDVRGYGDVYLLDLPEDCSSLPRWPGKPFRYYWE
ncbi:MAG: hypothetical protein EA402_02675 [Planctomycetota bacterium]|nr:MAG: hypothetical protein EA402_02675 [Planctomycetota bacterium]